MLVWLSRQGPETPNAVRDRRRVAA
jgi:hypothetical protein